MSPSRAERPKGVEAEQVKAGEVDVAEAAGLTAAGLALLVDVREDDEWTAGHVPAALHVPLGSLPQTQLPTGRLVLVICRSGNRSATAAAARLARSVDARNVRGGLAGRRTAGHPRPRAPGPAVMTVLLAVSLGLLIGLSLGALGGGGSILTVPALVYALGETAQSATTGSLVIVGITAAAAAVGHARAGRVRWRAGLSFGAAGVAASLIGTHLNTRVQPKALLIAFAVLMLIAAAAMLAKTMVARSPDVKHADEQAAALRRPAHAGTAVQARTGTAKVKTSVRKGLPVLTAGLVVGFLTGFLGVGGGFIIVPALVLTLQYDMPTAVGTSLIIISLNSAVALLARGGQDSFHWAVIVPFTLAAIAGSSAGKTVADRVSGPHLTRGFAVLLLLVAGYVLLRSRLSGT